MARTRRLLTTEAALHVISRGNNKQNVLKSDSDKLFYYSLLQKHKEENNIMIYHYCLMNTHVHLIIRLTEGSDLCRFMKQVNLTYCCYFRRNYDYVGHLWQGRYKSLIIAHEPYLMQCGKYIEQNPVRAGIVKFPHEYFFSSYCHYALGKADSLITDDPLYLDLSENHEDRRKQYIDFVIDRSIIESKGFTQGLFIGNEEVIKQQERLFQIQDSRAKPGRPWKK